MGVVREALIVYRESSYERSRVFDDLCYHTMDAIYFTDLFIVFAACAAWIWDVECELYD